MSATGFSAAAVEGGFADPVLDAQAAFHALMQAMARPGTVQPLAVEAGPPQPPAPMTPGLAAVALTLADPDTPVWLSPALATPAIKAWLAFHCGCPVVDDLGTAAFVFADTAEAVPDMAALSAGTQEYPDRGATLVLAVPALEGGPALTLEGPGIDGSAAFAPCGLAEDFVAQRAANRALFPRGADLILVSGMQAVALPRSTVVTRRELQEAV